MPPIRRRALLQGVAATTFLPLLGCTDSSHEATPSPMQADGPFRHGVASGDPLADGVILWTRVTPPEGTPERIALQVIVALDADFSAVVDVQPVQARRSQDYTVKFDARDHAR